MRYADRVHWLVLITLLLLLGTGGAIFAAGTKAQTINRPEAAEQVADDDEDDDIPEVMARVARVSFINGEAKIRRADTPDWERVTLNLPLVEGDEIATDADSHVEIQFDKNQHLRLAESSFLKIVNLKDEGIAVSISLGAMTLRITSFNKDKTFFEVDAPKTTLAVQRAGSYRIDAGKDGDTEIRMAATNGGEARVYSDNAGFTIKNGRNARIFIDGPNSGEWEAGDAAQATDDFDRWSNDRDEVIAKRLRDAYYDKYYDDDIYGADDLNGNGEWINTPDYGYVWRPYPTAVSSYADWSPYRYGHWRFMPPYGWIWVNDEPWGWATYHHGRWFYYDGYWVWSPYGYYRPSRSWWQPALVYVTVVSNNICWYPLPYHHRHYNFNWRYHNDRDHRNASHKNGRDNRASLPSPGKPPRDVVFDKIPRVGGRKPPIGIVPEKGVVAVGAGEFGTRGGSIKRLPPDIVKGVLNNKPEDGKKPDLPVFAEVSKRIKRDIITDKPVLDRTNRQTTVGAAVRKPDKPLDNELRTTRVFGGRPPRVENGDDSGVKGSSGGSFEPRRTGAVDRQPTVKNDEGSRPVNHDPVFTPREKPRDENPKPKESPRFKPPVEQDAPRVESPARKPPQSVEQPKPRDTPRFEPPKPKESPRSEPPPEREKPRNDPPKPKDNPPPKSEPKSEPKPDKPAPPAGRKDKPDGESLI